MPETAGALWRLIIQHRHRWTDRSLSHLLVTPLCLLDAKAFWFECGKEAGRDIDSESFWVHSFSEEVMTTWLLRKRKSRNYLQST
jgi:hypothetical protein